MKHPFFWFVIACTLIFTALLLVVSTTVYRYGNLHRVRGWDCTFEGDQCFVNSVRGPASGKLMQGDLVVAINGQPDFAGYTIQDHKMVMIPATGPYTVTIRRNATESTVRLTAMEERNIRFILPVTASIVAALIHFFVAAFVGLSRPAMKTVRLFSMAGLSMAISLLSFILTNVEEFMGPAQMRLSFLCMLLSFNPIGFPLAYHFYSRFPANFSETGIWNVLKKLLYIVAGAAAVCFSIFRFFMVWNPHETLQFAFNNSSTLTTLRRFADLMGLCALVAVGGVIVRNYRIVADSNLKRRIHWVAYGGIIGIVPLVFYFVGSLLLHLKFPLAPSEQLLTATIPVAILSLVAVPISVAYAILKNRIFDIQIVIRRGVQYLFAKGSLHLLMYLPVALIVYRIRTNPDRTIPELLFSNTSYLLLLIAAGSGLLFRKHLLVWLDRKFFREAYNSEKILVTLVEEIKNFDSMSKVASWVSEQLDSALHPQRIFVFYKQKGRKHFSLAYSSGSGDQELQIPESFNLLTIAETQARSLNLSSEEFQLPDNEKDWLRAIGIHLLVPMLASDQSLQGVLLLGEKKSEEPYSANDRKLLEALAGQMAVLYENLLLRDQVDEGARVQREVLAHLSPQRRNLVKECPSCGACFDSSENNCENDQTELVLSLPIERVIDGKYRLERLIGKGGMGAVYQAVDLRLNREVAIKILLGSKFGDSRALKRFGREARASARLNHPNIISIYDFGPIGEGAYIVMELLHGYSLREALRQWGNLHPEIASAWFDQILEGVKAAHLHGIIHRDLKPENVFITRDGKNQPLVKILDFGLAKMTAFEETQTKSLTEPGSILGTLWYMSPEQITGGIVDERTDIFALGVMAVEALTGDLPFDGLSPQEVAFAILQKAIRIDIDSPQGLRLDSVIQKCVAKNRVHRFSSIGEMHKDFVEAIQNAPPFASRKSSSADESKPTHDFLP
jgi:GAF domain-containing protein